MYFRCSAGRGSKTMLFSSSLVVILLLTGLSQASQHQHVLQFQLDESSQPCVQTEDTNRNWCQVPNDVTDDENNRCWLTSHHLCSGETRVGEGSICIDSLSRDVMRCEAGVWVDKGSQGEPANDRQRRWWWGRRRRRPRVVTVHNRAPSISCPSDVTRTASSGRTTSSVSWSTPNAWDDRGSPSVTQIAGPSSGSTFSEGATVIRYRARDSNGATAQCHFTVTVTVKRCPAVSRLTHGTRTCTGARSNVYGSTCTHVCDSGYIRQGQAQVTCGLNQRWSASFPHCQRVSCGTPTGVEGGEVVCPGAHLYGDTCSLQCRAGYQHTGATSITCTASGHWTSADRCQDVQAPLFLNGCPADQGLYAGPLASPVTVTWTDPEVKDNSGQGLTLTSSPVDKGSSLESGIHTVTITATDQAGNSGSCLFTISVTVRECPPLQHFSMGDVSCTKDRVEGSTCTLTCDIGYRVQGQGQMSVTCLATELWNATLEECQAVECPSPSPVSSGLISCPGHLYQDVCTLTCASGFSVKGQGSIRCLSNGIWTAPGVCEDVQPPVFDNGCPPNIQVFAQRLGQPTYVSWTSPAVSDNSGDVIDLMSDVSSGSAFGLNTTVVTYRATDVSGNTNSCHTNVTVTALTCEDPSDQLQPIINETSTSFTPMLSTCPDGHAFGASCKLACTSGYRLQGKDSVTCESDDSTYPPTMSWTWQGGSLLPHKPTCLEDPCPPLTPPKHGGVSCYLGNRGWLCYMLCEAGWDVPVHTDGRSICSPQTRVWIPGSLPDCVARVRPGRARILSHLLYFSGNCSASQVILRERFIQHIQQTVLRDGCMNTPSCVAENIEVTCHPLTSRPRRDTYSDASIMAKLRRARRHASELTSHYVLVTFQVAMPYVEEAQSPEKAYKHYHEVADHLTNLLKARATSGDLDADSLGLFADLSTVGGARVTADCPPGTVLSETSFTKHFSCVIGG